MGDKIIVKRFIFSNDFSRNDFIAFHFPMEDTALRKNPWVSYYDRMREAEYQAKQMGITTAEARRLVIEQNGGLETKEVVRRTPYFKRCVGMPGDKIQLRDGVLYLNDQKAFEPQDLYLTYLVSFEKGSLPTNEQLEEIGAQSMDAYMYYSPEGDTHVLRLTKAMAAKFKTFSWVKSIEPFFYKEKQVTDPIGNVFPNDILRYQWNMDNFGPVTIPKQGMKLPLNDSLLSQYARLIEVYEGNKLERRNGLFYINGKQANDYECKMNYYWMMGDNRSNSLDSRFWGFVPEDHLIGKATYVLMSIDKENGGLRSGRFFMPIEGK